jgi:hypothetical protein
MGGFKELISGMEIFVNLIRWFLVALICCIRLICMSIIEYFGPCDCLAVDKFNELSGWKLNIYLEKSFLN